MFNCVNSNDKIRFTKDKNQFNGEINRGQLQYDLRTFNSQQFEDELNMEIFDLRNIIAKIINKDKGKCLLKR